MKQVQIWESIYNHQFGRIVQKSVSHLLFRSALNITALHKIYRE